MLKKSLVALALSALIAGCTQSGAQSAQAAGGPGTKLSPAGKAALAKLENKDKVPADLVAEGLSVGPATVAKKPALTGQGQELEITGTFKNGSDRPVEGINLMVTFMGADGTVVGGHSTQQYFQPALAAGAEQPLVLRAPTLGGRADDAVKAEVKVISRVKQGESPDGWKPLDPKALPEPKVVEGSTKTVASNGQAVPSASNAPASPTPAAPSR